LTGTTPVAELPHFGQFAIIGWRGGSPIGSGAKIALHRLHCHKSQAAIFPQLGHLNGALIAVSNLAVNSFPHSRHLSLAL